MDEYYSKRFQHRDNLYLQELLVLLTTRVKSPEKDDCKNLVRVMNYPL